VNDNAARFTGEIPRFYDSGMGPTLFEPYAEVLAGLVAALEPRSVLELAAGTGISTRAIAKRIPEASMTVTDLNADMLAIAQEKAPSATFAVADAQDLDYEAGAFDVVAFQFGAMFLPDLAKGFREARRVVTDGGAFCFSVWGSHADNPAAAIVDQLLAEQFPDNPPPFWRVPYSRSDIDPTVELLQACGFGRVDLSVVPINAPVESWPRLAEGMLRGNPSGGQIEARRGSVEDVAAELTARLTRRFGEAPTTTPMQAIFYSAHAR
jgi:SAM-dependent methyltransferase